MADKFLCVMAVFDKVTEEYLSSLQQELYTNGFVGDHTKNIPQHITLETFDIAQEDKVIELMSSVALRTNPFDIAFQHIGIFSGSNVLFVAPDINRKLLELRECFGDSHNWTPHTTMLIDKPSRIYDSLPILANSFHSFPGRVEALYLYEFGPTRFIASIHLKE